MCHFFLNQVGTVTTGTTNSEDLDQLVVENAVYRDDNCLCFSSGYKLRESESVTVWTHNFEDPWIPAIFAVSLVFGLFALVLVVILLLLRRYPVTQKSSLVANILLLIGIMLMYCANIFYTRVPTNLVCGFRQFGTAFIYAWVFAALLVKCLATFITLDRKSGYDTTDNAEKKNKLGPWSQFWAFVVFLIPQIALSVQWIVISSPRVTSMPDTCNELLCDVSNRNIVLSMIYVFVLVLLTLVFSVLRLRDPRIVHESRSLFLSSLSSILLMVAWMICFVNADTIYQIPCICVGITANATVILLSCFCPVCCIITYGKGTKKPEEEDDKPDDGADHGDDIAYVNPGKSNNL